MLGGRGTFPYLLDVANLGTDLTKTLGPAGLPSMKLLLATTGIGTEAGIAKNARGRHSGSQGQRFELNLRTS